MLDVDTPTVRVAPAARIDDAGGDTSGEALRGLAVRHDPRATEPVRRRLQGPECDDLVVEAAAALGSPPVLLPELRRRKDHGLDRHVQEDWLDRAIEACSGMR